MIVDTNYISEHTGNSVARDFNIGFTFENESQVKVYLNGALITDATTYSIASGVLTYPTIASGLTVLSSRDKLLIKSDFTMAQDYNISNETVFNGVKFETALDKIYRRLGQVESISTSQSLSISEKTGLGLKITGELSDNNYLVYRKATNDFIGSASISGVKASTQGASFVQLETVEAMNDFLGNVTSTSLTGLSSLADDDTILIYDTSDSNNRKKITKANFRSTISATYSLLGTVKLNNGTNQSSTTVKSSLNDGYGTDGSGTLVQESFQNLKVLNSQLLVNVNSALLPTANAGLLTITPITIQNGDSKADFKLDFFDLTTKTNYTMNLSEVSAGSSELPVVGDTITQFKTLYSISDAVFKAGWRASGGANKYLDLWVRPITTDSSQNLIGGMTATIVAGYNLNDFYALEFYTENYTQAYAGTQDSETSRGTVNIADIPKNATSRQFISGAGTYGGYPEIQGYLSSETSIHISSFNNGTSSHVIKRIRGYFK